MTLSDYISGTFRLATAYYLAQALLFGIAVGISLVTNVGFVVARGSEFGGSDLGHLRSQAIGWTILAPWLMAMIARLVETALEMIIDVLKHSPFNNLNTHGEDVRAKLIFLSSGGSRPMLLRLRASLTALLAALLVKCTRRARIRTRSLLSPIGLWLSQKRSFS